MLQSFVNTNSFQTELGLGSREWVWPKINFRFEPFKGYSRFLRYPETRQGWGYRAMRVTVLAVLRVKGLCYN